MIRNGTIVDFILLSCWNGGLYAIFAILIWQLFKKHLKLPQGRWGMIIMDIIILAPVALFVYHLR